MEGGKSGDGEKYVRWKGRCREIVILSEEQTGVEGF